MATAHQVRSADTETRAHSERSRPVGLDSAAATAKIGEAARTASAAQHRVAEVIAERGRELSEGVARASDVYRDSTEFAADRMNAVLSSYAVLAGGMQEVQRTYMDMLQRSIETAAQGPREFLRCTNLSEVAELQHELLKKGLDEWLDGGTKLLRVSSRIAENAVRPIEQRVHGHAA
jgi:hypothetical protein